MSSGPILSPRGSAELANGVYDMAENVDLADDPKLEAQLRAIFETGEFHAKYRIQVMFNEERSEFRAYRGFIVMWYHNRNDDGDGDRSLYLCPRKIDVGGVTKPCNSPIPPQLISHKEGLSVCPRCRGASKPENLIGQIFARLPTQRWATLITRVFGVLECHADIEIDYLEQDLRVATDAIKEAGSRDALRTARAARKQVTYLLRRIVQDTSTGAGVETTIHNFLKV